MIGDFAPVAGRLLVPSSEVGREQLGVRNGLVGEPLGANGVFEPTVALCF